MARPKKHRELLTKQCKNINCDDTFEVVIGTQKEKKQWCSHKCRSSDVDEIERMKISQRKTWNEKYNGKHPMATAETQKRHKAAVMKNLGVEHALQSDKCKKKVKATLLERYGDENYNNPDKMKETCLKNYGVENPQQVKEIREKSLKTKIIKYGEGNSSNSKKAVATSKERWGDNFNNRVKTKETCIERFGCEYAAQSPEVQNKIKKTNLERYGVEFPLQSKEIVKKTHDTWKKNYKTLHGITYEQYLETLPEVKLYKRQVSIITNRQPIKILSNYNKRGKAGINGAYNLDHIFPIIEGFKNNIPPEVIGDISNLQFISWEENNKKSDNIHENLENVILISNKYLK